MGPLIRSLLFVPGSRPERFEKALGAGADMICIDLEDAVLPQDKNTARQAVVEFLRGLDVSVKHKVCVRANPLDTAEGQADLAALSSTKPALVMLAKCTSPEQVLGAQNQLNSPSTNILPLIETIEGLDNADAIASASSCVKAIMFGGGDMSAELRCEFSYEPLLFARSLLVKAAAKANVALIDVPYIDIKDVQGLIDETVKIKALGFTGKAAIHPCQIADIHTAFAPTQAQFEHAKQVVDAALKNDGGALVVNGRMIDRPIIIACERILELAQQADK
ncbi:citrate lyase [Glaciecola punicea]|jgi:citrate lyase subunit beta/citryl-CoA lyase/(S)-citramalyl-CoA lyase|uniref:HpcH/HpaI aldolase/citrate lyase family protein n=1 Tax=Glaciecola punicea TaxID=56804 RepID=UPI00087278A1|nr:CoA ester lyase [Glaciecola punicea]OFA29883.1 citrate lyase [Glaciecola punicea]